MGLGAETDGSETVPPFEGLPKGPTWWKSLGESGARGDERLVDTVPAMSVWHEVVHAAQ